jgi:hypothetical protein
MVATSAVSWLMLLRFSYGAFVLLNPPTELGILDESIAPCGGRDIQNRTNAIDYPESGLSFHVQSEGTSGIWKLQYNTDLQNDTWESLLPYGAIYQHGDAEFCMPSVPAPKNVIGSNAVVRIVEENSSGTFYQVCNSTRYS